MKEQQRSEPAGVHLTANRGEIASVQVSAQASARIREMLSSVRQDPAEYGLRLRLVGAGGSEFLCSLKLDKERDGDSVFESNGIKAFVDSASLIWLDGARLDYRPSGPLAGFTLRGPNLALGIPCRCGSRLPR